MRLFRDGQATPQGLRLLIFMAALMFIMSSLIVVLMYMFHHMLDKPQVFMCGLIAGGGYMMAFGLVATWWSEKPTKKVKPLSMV